MHALAGRVGGSARRTVERLGGAGGRRLTHAGASVGLECLMAISVALALAGILAACALYVRSAGAPPRPGRALRAGSTACSSTSTSWTSSTTRPWFGRSCRARRTPLDARRRPVIDGAVNGAGSSCAGSARSCARLQTGLAGNYATSSMFLGRV